MVGSKDLNITKKFIPAEVDLTSVSCKSL